MKNVLVLLEVWLTVFLILIFFFVVRVLFFRYFLRLFYGYLLRLLLLRVINDISWFLLGFFGLNVFLIGVWHLIEIVDVFFVVVNYISRCVRFISTAAISIFSTARLGLIGCLLVWASAPTAGFLLIFGLRIVDNRWVVATSSAA